MLLSCTVAADEVVQTHLHVIPAKARISSSVDILVCALLVIPAQAGIQTPYPPPSSFVSRAAKCPHPPVPFRLLSNLREVEKTRRLQHSGKS